MELKEIRKLIRQEFRDIHRLYGFKKRTDNLYIKITEKDILQDICFELRRECLTCNAAMQPLYAYNDTPVISFSFGGRIGHWKTSSRDRWLFENSSELQKCLKEIKLLLIKHAFPWFEQYGSPEGIIDFVQQNRDEEYKFYQFQIRGKQEYLAFSLLYTGNVQAGVECLEEYIKDTSPNSSEWWLQYKNSLSCIVTTIKKDPNNTQTLLRKFVTENKASLKLN